jgi:class 3 adenylate cyclase
VSSAERGESTAADRSKALAGALLDALSERLQRDPATVDATILFTDLAGFSGWLLEAGDEAALELLRSVAAVVEPVIASHHGRLVKRLGNGHMAVFTAARDGIEAALEMQARLSDLELGQHRSPLRAGLHTGQPQKLGGDYLGTDVNIAARVSAAARPGEVLATRAVLDTLEPGYRAQLSARRRRGFRAKGAPSGLQVFRISRG